MDFAIEYQQRLSFTFDKEDGGSRGTAPGQSLEQPYNSLYMHILLILLEMATEWRQRHESSDEPDPLGLRGVEGCVGRKPIDSVYDPDPDPKIRDLAYSQVCSNIRPCRNLAMGTLRIPDSVVHGAPKPNRRFTFST
jgi:hypothetical protein